ncbi:MAG: hypothetical protein NW215_10555 [Hyphomicrobiales bacterium]|nr:hypothetical protein [Hyphomicrobiales bacterium]
MTAAAYMTITESAKHAANEALEEVMDSHGKAFIVSLLMAMRHNPGVASNLMLTSAIASLAANVIGNTAMPRELKVAAVYETMHNAVGFALEHIAEFKTAETLQ